MATSPISSSASTTEGSTTLVDTELGHDHDHLTTSLLTTNINPIPKHISRKSICTDTLTIDTLHQDEAKPGQPITVRYRIKHLLLSLKNGTKKYLTKLRKFTLIVAIAIAAAVVFFLLDGIYVTLAYYLSYAQVYFNSKVAINIFRNSHTDDTLQAFLWISAVLAIVPNGVIGCLVGWAGWEIGRRVNMPFFIRVLWMIPWVVVGFALTTITLWGRPAIRGAYQVAIFNGGCVANGWDLDVVLSSSSNLTLPNTLPVVGTADISSTLSGANYSAQFTRHEDNQFRFDFTLTAVSGSFNPPFENITYDWENYMYIAWGQNSAKVSGAYSVTPNLSFQSLNLSLLDDSIPFQRPSYHRHCWPSPATLVLQNSTSSYFKVLKSLTLHPHDKTRMKVCGMAGSVAEEFQISLGVVFINHHYYSLCATNPVRHVQSSSDNWEPSVDEPSIPDADPGTFGGPG